MIPKPQSLLLSCAGRTVVVERTATGDCFIQHGSNRTSTHSIAARLLVQDALGLPADPARETRVEVGPAPLVGFISNSTYPPEAWFYNCNVVGPSGIVDSSGGTAPSIAAAAAAILEGLNEDEPVD